MPYLMQINFDNDRRLRRKCYLFEYKGQRFKLIQNNPKRWSDCLLSILPDDSEKCREATFEIASEFLSALSWRLRSRIMVGGCGGCGWRSNSPLGKAKPSSYTFPSLPFEGNKVGYELDKLPNVEFAHQRIALTLYREANAVNNHYLAFLFFWHVLETQKGNAIDYVNNIYRKRRKELKHLHDRYISSLPLKGRKLGNYLLEDCRHAIAHIRRPPSEKTLVFDKEVERARIEYSTLVIKAFAEHYIAHALNLGDSVILVRRSQKAFPIFLSEKGVSKGVFNMASSSK